MAGPSISGPCFTEYGMTKRQKLFVHEYVSNPGRPVTESVKAAGYSKKRLSETASDLMKHTEVQAAIQKALDLKLQTAPTRESVYKAINEAREMARRSGDSAWAGQLLLKCAETEAKILGMFAEQLPPPPEVNNQAITVQFISPDMSTEQIEQLNASARDMESKLALTEGTLGRLPAEGQQQAAGPEILPPVAPKPYVEPTYGYCSWRGHGSYEGPECPKCLQEGKKELRVGIIPGTPGWTQ